MIEIDITGAMSVDEDEIRQMPIIFQGSFNGHKCVCYQDTYKKFKVFLSEKRDTMKYRIYEIAKSGNVFLLSIIITTSEKIASGDYPEIYVGTISLPNGSLAVKEKDAVDFLIKKVEDRLHRKKDTAPIPNVRQKLREALLSDTE